MERASRYILFITLVAFLVPGSLSGADTFPKPQGLVNDFAGVVRSPFKEQLIDATQEILKKTGVPIVVVTMPQIGGQDYEEFANRLYGAWGIGKAGENRGVLIFLTVQERKMRIETGYGVEGILPDGLVGQIRDRYMLPYLREDRYGEGLLAGTAAVGRILAEHAGVDLSGTEAPARTGKPGRRRSSVAGLFFTLVFFAILLSMARRRGGVLPALLLMSMGRGGHFGQRSGGSGFGGFGGGFGGFGGGSSGGGGAGGGF